MAITIEQLKAKNEAIVITTGSFKGGVSKTTNTALISHTLAKKGIKVLTVDLDPQSNLTKTMMLTKSANEPDTIMSIEKTIMKAVTDASFEGLAVNIMDNLDILPSFIDFENFPKYLYKELEDESRIDFVISDLLNPLKKDYDLIMIDVPPMSLEITRNAIVASDYVLIPLQTQEHSLTGAENYIDELEKINEKYNLELLVLGILPVLWKNDGRVDAYILKAAKDIFGEDNLFKTVIKQMERIKRFDVNGITNRDRHDAKVIEKYEEVTNELLERLGNFEDMKAGVVNE